MFILKYNKKYETFSIFQFYALNNVWSICCISSVWFNGKKIMILPMLLSSSGRWTGALCTINSVSPGKFMGFTHKYLLTDRTNSSWNQSLKQVWSIKLFLWSLYRSRREQFSNALCFCYFAVSSKYDLGLPVCSIWSPV